MTGVWQQLSSWFGPAKKEGNRYGDISFSRRTPSMPPSFPPPSVSPLPDVVSSLSHICSFLPFPQTLLMSQSWETKNAHFKKWYAYKSKEPGEPEIVAHWGWRNVQNTAGNTFYPSVFVYELLDQHEITNLLWPEEDAEHPLSAGLTIKQLPVFKAGWIVIPCGAQKLEVTKICLQGPLQSSNDVKPEHVKRAVFYVFPWVTWMSGDT